MNRNIEDAPVYMILNQLVHLGKYQSMKRLEEFDLKPNQAGILFILSCSGKLSQRELAERMGITPPSMTVALRKLEERGYVDKEPDEKDQRIMRILLTKKGRDCVGAIKTVTSQMEEILYYRISQEEKLLMRRLLLQMRQNLLESKYFRGMNMEQVMEHTRPHMRDRL